MFQLLCRYEFAFDPTLSSSSLPTLIWIVNEALVLQSVSRAPAVAAVSCVSVRAQGQIMNRGGGSLFCWVDSSFSATTLNRSYPVVKTIRPTPWWEQEAGFSLLRSVKSGFLSLSFSHTFWEENMGDTVCLSTIIQTTVSFNNVSHSSKWSKYRELKNSKKGKSALLHCIDIEWNA